MGYIDDIHENTNQYKMNNEIKKYKVISDKNKNIILPEEVKKKLGLKENSEIKIMARKDRIELLPNIHSLSKVYIEPTSFCNLKCKTCIRNTWNGKMRIETLY